MGSKGLESPLRRKKNFQR